MPTFLGTVMHAIIKVGTHQYDVTPGQIVTMEKIDGPVGSEVRFTDLLLVNNDKDVSVKPESKGAVVGKIIEQSRGEKITVFHKIRRKGHHKKQGHRQFYSKVEITGIEV